MRNAYYVTGSLALITRSLNCNYFFTYCASRINLPLILAMNRLNLHESLSNGSR